MEQKIKYIEDKPIKREIIFNDSGEYVKFFDEYYRGIIEHCWDNRIKVGDYYSYRRYKLNKNGIPRKLVFPKWLHTEQARKKQKEKWKEYQEKRRIIYLQKFYLKERLRIENKIRESEFELKKLESEMKEKGII